MWIYFIFFLAFLILNFRRIFLTFFVLHIRDIDYRKNVLFFYFSFGINDWILFNISSITQSISSFVFKTKRLLNYYSAITYKLLCVCLLMKHFMYNNIMWIFIIQFICSITYKQSICILTSQFYMFMLIVLYHYVSNH